MDNPFPSSYEAKRYYVYFHYDQAVNEVLYVGHGTGPRAWVMNYPLRSAEHAKFLKDLETRGDIPADWVVIQDRNLSKKDACSIERKYIKKYKPRFNKIQGEKLLKVTPDLLKQAFSLRTKGYSYSKIANALNLGVMTVHSSMNGKSISLEEILERQN